MRSYDKNSDSDQPLIINRGAPDVSTSDVMLIQESLAVQGLYKGEVDGIPGSRTLRAVREYKKSQKLPVNNVLNAEFVSLLRQSF